MTRLSQSGGGNSLMGSTHMLQLQENLRESRRQLERSEDAKASSERAKRRLEAQLEDYQKKYDDMFESKLKLENGKLDLEQQVGEISDFLRKRGCPYHKRGRLLQSLLVSVEVYTCTTNTHTHTHTSSGA